MTQLTDDTSPRIPVAIIEDGTIVAPAANWAFHQYETMTTLDATGNVLGTLDYGAPVGSQLYATAFSVRQCERVLAGSLYGTMSVPNTEGGTTTLTTQFFVPGGAFVMRIAP